MTLKRFWFIGILIGFLTSCGADPLNVDVSDVNIDLGFVNIDSSLVNADSAELIETHHKFKTLIPEVYEYQLGYCLGIGNVEDSAFYNSISLFLKEPYIARVEQRISEKFSDLSPIKNKITDGFKHLKYHFPKGVFPKNVAFMNSFFASNAFSTEKEIGIGLERYLGKETDVIKELPPDKFYEWMKDGLDEKFIARDALCSWIMTHYVEEINGNLAEHLIRWGKIIYLTEAAFPEESDALIMRYSEEDLKWAIDQEYDIWTYLVTDKLLFKTDEKIRINMINDGPFTVGLPEKGPDRLGQFLGWRMVKKYMEIKKISLEELLKTPYTSILSEYEID
jgi:hypothetical protein